MKKEENLALYNEVRSVPDEAKSRITGGRMNGKTSIDPMWRIKVLTEQFGPCGLGWYYVPVKNWVEPAGEELLVFVDIELYVKFGDEWSKPIHGIGGGKLISKEVRGLNVSDECYKMAVTDALSVVCKQLGIGADVYWNKDDPSSAERREDTEHEAPMLLDDVLIKKLSAEAEKKGVRISSILQQYQKNALNELSYEEYTETMKMLVSKRDILEERYVNSLQKELNRTGISVNSLLRNYKKCSIQKLSFEEYKDAMNKLTAKPDKPGKPKDSPAPAPDKPPDPEKPLNPALIPPDDYNPKGTPWHSKEEKDKQEEKVAPVQEAGQEKEARQEKDSSMASSGIIPSLLSATLAADGYSYCGSFGGN